MNVSDGSDYLWLWMVSKNAADEKYGQWQD